MTDCSGLPVATDCSILPVAVSPVASILLPVNISSATSSMSERVASLIMMSSDLAPGNDVRNVKKPIFKTTLLLNAKNNLLIIIHNMYSVYYLQCSRSSRLMT